MSISESGERAADFIRAATYCSYWQQLRALWRRYPAGKFPEFTGTTRYALIALGCVFLFLMAVSLMLRERGCQ